MCGFSAVFFHFYYWIIFPDKILVRRFFLSRLLSKKCRKVNVEERLYFRGSSSDQKQKVETLCCTNSGGKFERVQSGGTTFVVSAGGGFLTTDCRFDLYLFLGLPKKPVITIWIVLHKFSILSQVFLFFSISVSAKHTIYAVRLRLSSLSCF